MNQDNSEEKDIVPVIEANPENKELADIANLVYTKDIAPVIAEVKNVTTEPEKAPEVEAQVVTPEATPVTYAGTEEVILEVKQKKEKGPFGIIALFIILIGFVVFLPQLTPYIDKYLNKDNKINNNNQDDKKDDKPIVKEVYYKLEEKLTIKLDDIEISEISIITGDNSDYYFKFKLKNTTNKEFDFSKKYYIQIYNNDPTLLSRVKIFDLLPLQAEETRELTLRTKAEALNATQISVSALTETDYPPIILDADEAANQVLTCTSQNEVYTYKLIDYKLKNLNHTSTILTTDYLSIDEYNISKSSATLAMDKLNLIEGITALVSDTDTGYITSIDIDYLTVDGRELEKLDKYEYYDLDTQAKVIHFEMKAMGYTCK